SPAHWPKGCKFHPRCHRTREQAASAPPDQTLEVAAADQPVRVMRRCVEQIPDAPTSGEPALREVQGRHWAACHYTEGFEAAPITRPQIEHQRQVRPQV